MKVLLAALCVALFAAGGSAAAQMNAYGTAAKVNGVAISNETLERNFEEYQRDKDVNIAAIRYPKRVNTMRREVLEQLIDQEVLWQAAQKDALIATPEEIDAALQELRAQFTSERNFIARLATEGYSVDSYREHLRQLLSARKYLRAVTADTTISDAEVHEFYEANPSKFQLPEAVRASHILLTLAPNADEETRKVVFERAATLLQRLAAGEDFASVAMEASEDSSAAQGGDLGYFPRGKMVPAFEDAAFALQVGETSDIVQSPFGLHMIKLLDRQAAQKVPEELAKEKISQYLMQARSQQRVSEAIAALRSAASIEILAAQ